MLLSIILQSALIWLFWVLNTSDTYLLWGCADETEDEEVEKEYVEETNRDAIMIAAAKLIATDAVPKVSIWFTLHKLVGSLWDLGLCHPFGFKC